MPVRGLAIVPRVPVWSCWEAEKTRVGAGLSAVGACFPVGGADASGSRAVSSVQRGRWQQPTLQCLPSGGSRRKWEERTRKGVCVGGSQESECRLSKTGDLRVRN